MISQNFRIADQSVVNAYIAARATWEQTPAPIRLAWSNWGFGSEPLAKSLDRLASNEVRYVELHGNLYGPDLGYRASEVTRLLDDYGVQVSGVCGMVMPTQEFASNRPHIRQRMLDYTRRQIDFCAEVGGSYLLFGAGAVGRPIKDDDHEFGRAAATMRIAAEMLEAGGIRGALEPIRPEEVSLVHTFDEALRMLDEIDHPGLQYLNGDLYHMLSGETHIGATLLAHGDRMINLHLADTNRRALGDGLLDLDIVFMALFASGYHARDTYCSAEPLGAGGNPYLAMHGRPDPEVLDGMVARTAQVFNDRQRAVLEADDDELRRAYGID